MRLHDVWLKPDTTCRRGEGGATGPENKLDDSCVFSAIAPV